MSDPAIDAIDEPVEETSGPWPNRLWWIVAAAVLAVAAWDVTGAMAAPGGIGDGIGEAFPLVIPLGFAWWGRRIGSLGFGILAVAVVIVEVAILRLGLLFV